MATWKSAAYDGRYLQLDISESVNVVGNSSTLSWTLTSTGGASTYYTIDTTTVTINGTQVYYKARTAWDSKVFPAKKGSVSGTITVAHDSNGSKTITVGFSTRVYIYGPQEYGGSMTLTTIDRSAPTVTFSTSNVTANGFKISATSSATADIWQYSTNGGSSWTQFSTTTSTSASVTLSSLSPNTSYTVRVRARRQYNHVYGTSGSSTVKTLGGAVVNSVNTVTADNATVSITINVTVYEASYTNTLVLKNGSATILTISGLSWSKGTANRTVTLTSSQRTTLLNAMASIKSFTGTFAVSSYSGSTQIGSTSSQTATVLTTATNSAPTISGFTYADSYTTTKNLTGNDQLFVQDYSTLKVTPGTATAKNGASISNYTASCNGLSASNSTGSAITVGKIAKSGSVTVTLSVTDSRGYTAETSQTVTVIPYTKPKISSITLRRTNDIEAEMQLKFSGSISAVTVDGTQKNSVVYVRYRYKKTSESSYGSYTSIYSGTTKSGTSFSYSNLELCSLDANSSYDLHLQIQDKLYSLSSLDLYFTVPQGTPLIALRKKKVGINTPNPQATLDVDGNIHMNGVNVHGKMGRVDGSTTDLNNVKTPGYYFAYSASTEKHFPTTTIGIECASDNTEPYAFKAVVYKRLIELCTDICRRNGKTKLLWLGDKAKTLNYTPRSDEMVLTVHRWFANKSCPGNWMYARMGDLASKVTATLSGDVKPANPVKPTGTIKAGDLVTITGSTYYNGKAIPGWVKKLRWYVVEVSGDRAVINKDESGKYAIMSPVKTSALAVAGTKPSEDYRIHTVVHGDTLWAIAKKYLGNGSRYKEIVSLNGLKSNVIYSGMKLKIPNK